VPPSVSIVFPMYNEEAYIHRAVRAARAALQQIPDHEIVIVDDCSTDRTGALADELARQDPRVKVVHNPVNRRLGGTLRAGYAVATKELLLYTDADLPFDLQEELPRAVRLLEYQEADVLSAYRFDRTSEGFVRTVYSFVYNTLIRLLFGLRVKDVNFSFKLFRRALLDKFQLKSEGSLIDVEFLVRAKKAGANIIQIGVDYFPRSRGLSTLSSPAVIVKILKELFGLWGELR
jgi:glycosyltransferase involved in cell wall biosynthesis